MHWRAEKTFAVFAFSMWRLVRNAAAFSALGALDVRLVEALTLQQVASGPVAPAGMAASPAQAAAGQTPASVPPADAATMKTWVFLKESMQKLRGEVQQVMLVKDDMAEMKDDLKEQEGLWAQAEKDLTAENAKLASDLATLREQVHGNPIAMEVAAAKGVLAREKIKSTQLFKKLEADEAGRDLTRSFWKERAANLTKQVEHLNATDQAELGRQHEIQLQLETDTVALRLKSSELSDRLKSGMDAYQMAQRQANLKKGELEKQLMAMRQALARVQTQLHQTSQEMQQQQLAKAQADVDKMTAEMVQLAQTQSEVAASCSTEKSKRYEVACAERDKTQKRQEETRQLCQPVKGQQSALQMLLSECQAKTAAVAPTGMSPATPAY